MLLGILSDTHGNKRRAAAAVRLLKRLGVDALVHCGDVGGAHVVDELVGIPAWLVWGNTDAADVLSTHYAQTLGIQVASPAPARIARDGRVVLVFHGHEGEFAMLEARAAVDRHHETHGEVDCVLHGHTHLAGERRISAVRFINPGALHRAAVHSVATLDLKDGALRFWQVTDAPAPAPVAYEPA